jgi:hypothetical protein
MRIKDDPHLNQTYENLGAGTANEQDQEQLWKQLHVSMMNEQNNQMTKLRLDHDGVSRDLGILKNSWAQLKGKLKHLNKNSSKLAKQSQETHVNGRLKTTLDPTILTKKIDQLKSQKARIIEQAKQIRDARQKLQARKKGLIEQANELRLRRQELEQLTPTQTAGQPTAPSKRKQDQMAAPAQAAMAQAATAAQTTRATTAATAATATLTKKAPGSHCPPRR